MAKRILLVVAATLIIAAGFVFAAFYVGIQRDYERVQARGTVISSPYGDIEYTQSGTGPAVLVIHGSGGGYDQGELIADAVLGAQTSGPSHPRASDTCAPRSMKVRLGMTRRMHTATCWITSA